MQESIIREEDKDFMRETIFYRFNVLPEYIQDKNILDDIEVYHLQDENNVQATLKIDFKDSKYIITSNGESLETIYMVID